MRGDNRAVMLSRTQTAKQRWVLLPFVLAALLLSTSLIADAQLTLIPGNAGSPVSGPSSSLFGPPPLAIQSPPPAEPPPPPPITAPPPATGPPPPGVGNPPPASLAPPPRRPPPPGRIPPPSTGSSLSSPGVVRGTNSSQVETPPDGTPPPSTPQQIPPPQPQATPLPSSPPPQQRQNPPPSQPPSEPTPPEPPPPASSRTPASPVSPPPAPSSLVETPGSAVPTSETPSEPPAPAESTTPGIRAPGTLSGANSTSSPTTNSTAPSPNETTPGVEESPSPRTPVPRTASVPPSTPNRTAGTPPSPPPQQEASPVNGISTPGLIANAPPPATITSEEPAAAPAEQTSEPSAAPSADAPPPDPAPADESAAPSSVEEPEAPAAAPAAANESVVAPAESPAASPEAAVAPAPQPTNATAPALLSPGPSNATPPTSEPRPPAPAQDAPAPAPDASATPPATTPITLIPVPIGPAPEVFSAPINAEAGVPPGSAFAVAPNGPGPAMAAPPFEPPGLSPNGSAIQNVTLAPAPSSRAPAPSARNASSPGATVPAPSPGAIRGSVPSQGPSPEQGRATSAPAPSPLQGGVSFPGPASAVMAPGPGTEPSSSLSSGSPVPAPANATGPLVSAPGPGRLQAPSPLVVLPSAPGSLGLAIPAPASVLAPVPTLDGAPAQLLTSNVAPMPGPLPPILAPLVLPHIPSPGYAPSSPNPGPLPAPTESKGPAQEPSAGAVQAPGPQGFGGIGGGAVSGSPIGSPITSVSTASFDGSGPTAESVFGPFSSFLASSPVGYAPSALAPELEYNLQFYNGPSLAPAPGLTDWLTGAQQIGTNLYYVAAESNRGFYTITETPTGYSPKVAFSTVPAGANVSSYSVLGMQILLDDCPVFPLNVTYQAMILNQLHIAYDAVGMPHILQFQKAENVTVTDTSASSGSTGRRLAQENSDGIVNAVSDNVNASVQVSTTQNVSVSLTVSVPFQDQNNATAVVQSAINSGQIRRGLIEAGLPVQNATVTRVNSISTGTNPDLVPRAPPNDATPQSSDSGGVSAGVIAGAVIGAVAAISLILGLLFFGYRRKARRMEDLEASKAQKLDPSDTMAQIYANGHGRHPGYIKTGFNKSSADGILLSNGYSSADSPYAQSVQPMSAQTHFSETYKALLSVPDTPDWKPYRDFVYRGQQNFLNHTTNSEHLLDANVPQVMRVDLKMDKEIGKGSFGKVSIARWRGLTVAVKELKGNSEIGFHTTTPEILKNLQKEASMMAAMRHPNVVLFLGICIESPAIVTEYCARGSLYEVIQKWNQGKEVANWLRRLGMVLDAAKGMQYLHSCSPPLIHRDLKTPNLLVDKNYIVKICDFNLSKVMENSMCNVTSSLASVNPRWQAPEILQEKGYSKASDVYSFGIVLWEMLTWQVPWKDLNTWQIMGMLSHGPDFRPEIPEDLESLPGGTFEGIHHYVQLMKDCWAEDPQERPDFPVVAETLRRIMGQEATLRRERSGKRNPSLGTEAGNSGLFSFGTGSQPHMTDNDSNSD